MSIYDTPAIKEAEDKMTETQKAVEAALTELRAAIAERHRELGMPE